MSKTASCHLLSSRWWFQTFFIFTPKIGEDSHFDSYFSKGLVQPPTSESSWGFCAYTLVADSLEDAAVLIVTDARRDLRFMRNPLVLGEPYIQCLWVKLVDWWFNWLIVWLSLLVCCWVLFLGPKNCRFMKIERKPCLSLDFFRCNMVPNQSPSTRSAICICVAKTQESFLAKITHWSVSQRAVIKIKQDSTFDLVNWVCITHGTKIIFQSSTDWFSENNYAWSSRSAKSLFLQKNASFQPWQGFHSLSLKRD